MDTFLSTILPKQGVYCSFGANGVGVRQSFHNTITELEAAGGQLDEAKFDAYYALASFSDADAGRKQSNALALRAFFADIDCGSEKPYQDQAAAAVALKSFLDATGLPMPTIVNSGGGLHVYWVMDRDVLVAEWVPIARALKTLCSKNGLRIDPSVTADCARVLRVPGTHNHKGGANRAVQILRQGKPVSVEAFSGMMQGLIEIDFSPGVDEATAALTETSYPDAEFARIVRRSLKGSGCAQISHIVQDKATLEEPLWRAGLSIASRCIDRETAIQKVSQGHPGYDPDAALAKANATKGPYTCDWFKHNYPAGCEGCKQRVTSPIALGRVVLEADADADADAYVIQAALDADADSAQQQVAVTIPKYPFPYFRGTNGGVYLKTKDKAGDPIELEIYRDDLYLTARFYDIDLDGEGDGEMVGINLHLTHDGVRRFYSPITTLFSPDKLRDLLVKHGAIAYGPQLHLIMNYFASTIRQLQSKYAADRTRNQMGWTLDSQGFVIGEIEYTTTGPRLAPPGSGMRQLAAAFRQKGTLEGWKKIANFYNRPNMEAQALALFFGFGSPLLKFIGGSSVKGAMINLMSGSSGSGKTTAQQLINSIFGHPRELLLEQKDTTATRYHRLGMLNNIATTVDEITNMSDTDLSDMVYGITSGRGRHRMEAQSNKMRTNHTMWCGFTITSSNAAMVDKLRQLKTIADGELRRLIEIYVPPCFDYPKTEVDEVFRGLDEHFGVAGPIYAAHLVSIQESLSNTLKAMQLTVDADMGHTQTDRFYSCAFACAFVGAMLAKQLGLHDIDIDRVYRYATQHALKRKETLSDKVDVLDAAKEALTTYINENINSVLVINSIGRGALPSAPIREVKGNQLKVRYEPDTQELSVVASDFRRYCSSKQVDVQRSIEAMVAAGLMRSGGKEYSKRIGAGALAGVPAMPVRCYCFDGNALGLDIALGLDAPSEPPGA